MADKNSGEVSKRHRADQSAEKETHLTVSAAPSFTAGPWNTKWNGVYGRYLVCGGKSNTCLATVGGKAPGITASEGKGNSLLINAAPDLYKALVAVVAIADRRTVEFDQARAALALANGQATSEQKG